MRNRYIQTLTAFTLSLLLMMLLRLFFLLRYPEDFSSLSTSELFQTLIMGGRIDIITLFTFTGIFILILTLPVKLLAKPKIRQSLALVWAGILVCIVSVSMGDIPYFEFSRRHLSSEVFNLGNDIDLVIDMAFGSFLFYTLGAAVFSLILFYVFIKIFRHKPLAVNSYKKAWISSLLILVFIIAGIRGTLTGSESIGVADAFAVNKVCSGNLALTDFSVSTALVKRVICIF